MIIRNNVAIFNNSFEAAFVSLGTTPLSLKTFPIMNIVIKGADLGTTRIIITIAKTGNMSLSLLETSLEPGISIALSLWLVNNFIIGGCIKATAAIYE